jgi:small-conductance mechanosensitive channel
VTNPVKVVHSSGTIVSTQLSLGYDQHHTEIEALLVEAAQASGLEEAFVQILELGDFSVTYRVAGFLSDVKQLLSVRSRLQASVLDMLHGAGVETVSPTFMN